MPFFHSKCQKASVTPARPDWRCLNGCRWSCSSSWTGCRCVRCTTPWTASRTTPSSSPMWALFLPSPGAPTGALLRLTPHPHPTGLDIGFSPTFGKCCLLIFDFFWWEFRVEFDYFFASCVRAGQYIDKKKYIAEYTYIYKCCPY